MEWLVKRGDPHVTGRVFEKRALQEWNLFSQADCNTLKVAVKTLHAKLDPGNQTLCALDFHNAVQKDSETVVEFIDV